jgi:hypothetical protein
MIILTERPSAASASAFKEWGRKMAERDYLYYDITSVSSYGQLNEYLKYGYNLALLFGQMSELPLYFNRLPGNVSDVATLRYFLEVFGYLELPRLHLVLDKGFYSEKNVNELLAGNSRFIMAVPGRRSWIRAIIDEVRDSIQDPEGYRRLEGEVLYVHTRRHAWGENRKRCYVRLPMSSPRSCWATRRNWSRGSR